MQSSRDNKSVWMMASLFGGGLLFAIAETAEWINDRNGQSLNSTGIFTLLYSWAPILAMTAVYHLCMWSAPARHAAVIAEDIRNGKRATDELLNIPGVSAGLVPLVHVLRQTLIDLKKSKAERAALDLEMRGRIAGRTQALQRQIGSLTIQASRDPLTALSNRRELDSFLIRSIEQFSNSLIDSCLLMIDIDHFKPLNDTLGHAAGDELLVSIAQLLRSSIREIDRAFRTGGDEFVVLLNGCDAKSGEAMARRLESLVQQMTGVLRVATPPTLSIGVCTVSQVPQPTAATLLQAADDRLYTVKASRPGTRRTA